MHFYLQSLVLIFVALSNKLCAEGYIRPFAPYFSQCGQDKYLNEAFFKNKREGTFIEIGAHDGVSFSNTYYFEKELGWKGVCIEPHPDRFEELTLNRSSICLQACVGSQTGTSQYLKIVGAPEMLSGLYDFYDPRHLARIELELQQNGGTKELIEIPVIRLDDLFSQMGLTYVDFISIDTEGSEFDIIQSIDFDAVDIDILVIENNYGENQLRDYILEKGYRHINNVGGDEIYQKVR